MTPRPESLPGRPLLREELEEGLRRIMPQARTLAVDSYSPENGSFRAIVTLPSRVGQADVTIRRFALDGDAPGDNETDPRITKPQRLSMSGETMWGWYVDYDDAGISEEEVRVLIAKPLVLDPILSYPRQISV